MITLSPKMDLIAYQYKLTNEQAKLIAKCLFCPSFADCLTSGNYVLFVTKDNVCVETTMAIVHRMTQKFN